ncbi:MAG: response regulator [Anaerolineae bacterium]|nr:response regulator [Anaerolineae bacterium]
MGKVYSGSPVPRNAVFILADGSFVVQWGEMRVQELLTGRYRTYHDHDFSHAITDYELAQLKVAGRVEHYNRQYVWLYALPESGRFDHLHELENRHRRVRSYYLNTTLPKARLEEIQTLLTAAALDDDFLARVRGDVIAILGKNGAPYHNLQDAELAQKYLVARAPAVFQHTAVAFVETNENANHFVQADGETSDLKTVIASQTDVTVTRGKRVVLVVGPEDERSAIRKLLLDMEMDVQTASSAGEGLQLLEDEVPHLLIMDLQLPDMHGWQMLAKLNEIDFLRQLPKIIIADHSAASDTQAFALTVVKADIYLMKPVSMAQLRQNIWMTLRGNQDHGQNQDFDQTSQTSN